ncbi:MAG: ribonuclease E/G [Syntrophobacterales bacterium]
MSRARKMLINAADPEEFRVAILEEGLLSEFALEAASRKQTKGNIYKGVVANVEPSLQAAFVNYGGNRHGFLPLSEVHPDYYQEKVKERSKVRIQQALKKGQELIVQVIKEESPTKGAYLSTYLSLPGRYLVLLVKQSHLGISRKIEKEEERQRLKDLAQKLGVPSEMGVIVRTVGEQGKQRTIAKDLNFLLKLWKDIQKAAEKPAPCLLYKDLDVITRTVRDYCAPDIKTILVDDREVHAQLKDFLRLVSPNQVRALKLYQDKMPLFIRYQIEDQIERLCCLNQCNLEETAYKTNLEAAEEIARQLRLRDLGGLVVIDFIDMRDKKHVKAVEQALKQALKLDKARVTVGHIGKFGLLELSRQRLRPASETSTYVPCSACQGRGRVKSVTALGLSLLRQMSMQLSQASCREVQALLPLEVANFLLNQKRKELLALEEQHNLKIIFTARPGLPLEEIQLDYVKAETKEPQATKGEAKESRRAKPVDEIRPGKISPPLTS